MNKEDLEKFRILERQKIFFKHCRRSKNPKIPEDLKSCVGCFFWNNDICISDTNCDREAAFKDIGKWEEEQKKEEIKRKIHISFSALSTLFKCPEKYRRQYIEKERTPSAISLILGNATHKSIERNLKNMILNQSMLPEKECEEIARDAFVIEFTRQPIKLKEDEKAIGLTKLKDKGKFDAAALALLHRVKVAPGLHPKASERYFKLAIKDTNYMITGKMDDDEGNEVRDVKTTSKSPKGDEAEKSQQLSFYALAKRILDGKMPEGLYLDYLVNLKTKAKYVPLKTERTEDDLNILFKRIKKGIDVIEAGVFPPCESSSWWCSDVFCGYYQTCPYIRRPKIVLVKSTDKKQEVKT